jgi:hypothetical protein
MPVISALGRLKQDDLAFEARLCYIVSSLKYRARPCLKKNRKKKE